MKSTNTTDGRSRESKRFKSLVTNITELVGDRLPPKVVETLSHQFASLAIQQTRHTKRLLDGQHVNGAAYVRLVNCSNRCLRNLGLLPAETANDPDDGVDMLERYATSKREAAANGAKRKIDKRRERMGR